MSEKQKSKRRCVRVAGVCLYSPYKGREVRFGSYHDAARWVGGGERVKTLVQQIRACCEGRQKTAYMIKWRKV